MARTNMKANVLTVFCRACHSRITFSERPELYDLVTCPECDEVLEVINVSPIRLDWPSDFGDDDEWSDDSYDDDRYDS